MKQSFSPKPRHFQNIIQPTSKKCWCFMIFPNVVYHVFFNEPPKFLENSSHHCLSGTWKVVGRCRIGCLEGTQASYPPRICCLIGRWFAWLICWLDGWWFVFFDGLRCFWFHWFGCVVLSWDDEVNWILSLNHPTWCSPPGPNVQNKLPQIDHDVSPLKGREKNMMCKRVWWKWKHSQVW